MYQTAGCDSAGLHLCGSHLSTWKARRCLKLLSWLYAGVYLRNASSSDDLEAVGPPAVAQGFTALQAQDYLSGDLPCNGSLDQGYCHIVGDTQVGRLVAWLPQHQYLCNSLTMAISVNMVEVTSQRLPTAADPLQNACVGSAAEPCISCPAPTGAVP